MPKSRSRKNHKQKLKARNQRIDHAKKAMKKQQTKFLEELIAKEQAAGKFEDNKTFGDDLIIDGTQGPEI